MQLQGKVIILILRLWSLHTLSDPSFLPCIWRNFSKSEENGQHIPCGLLCAYFDSASSPVNPLFSFHAFYYYFHSEPSPTAHIFILRILLQRLVSLFECGYRLGECSLPSQGMDYQFDFPTTFPFLLTVGHPSWLWCYRGVVAPSPNLKEVLRREIQGLKVLPVYRY